MKNILLIGPKYVAFLLAHNWFLRYVTLWFARGLGYIYYVFSREWIPPVLGFIATVLVVWIADQVTFTLAAIPWFPLKMLLQSLEKWIQFMWSNPWSFLALYTLLWLLWWAWQARHRLVVEEFANYTAKQLSTDVQGLATLLVVRLAQLHNLYRTVDEQRAISTSVLENESIDATIKVEDIDELLKDAVSSRSELSLGPLKIPVGTLMSLIGRFVQGPRILGSLHNDGGKLILIAQSVGGRNSFKWRVDQVVQSTEPHSPDLVSMVEELACRIFTDLALGGSVRWEATDAFSEGLRKYRECLHIPRDRRAHLKQAEKKFIETLAEDIRFNLAYYNLGVVHTELGHTMAAETAFEKAIIQSPNSWEAYYALALSCYDSKNYYRTVQLCKRVIELKPKGEHLAKAYQLKGLAECTLYDVKKKELLDKKTKGCIQPDEYERELTQLQSGYLKGSVKSRRKAVMHSWVALCFAELSKQDAVITKESKISRLETLASVCVADLAEVENRRRKKVQLAKHLLKQALSLTHADGSYRALYYFKLGKVYCLQGKYADATNKLRRATRIAPDCVTYWAELAEAYAYAVTHKDQDKSREKETCDENYEKYVLETIIDSASHALGKDFRGTLAKAAKAYEKLDTLEKRNEDRSQSMKQIGAFVDLSHFFDLLDRVEETKNKGEFEEKLRYYEQSGSQYEHATDFLKLGYLYLKCDEEENYNELIRELEQQLEQHKDEEPVYARISLTLGQWYLNCNKKQKIDELIEKLERQLENFAIDGKEWEHGQRLRILAQLHFLAGQFGEAENKCRLAIQKLEKKYPGEVRLRRLWPLLASILSEQGKHCEAVQVVQRAVSFDALDCYTHERLGDMYFEREEFEHAIDAWKEALARKSVIMQSPHDPDIDFKIGRAYAQLAQQHHASSQKKIENQKALAYLKHALDYYENNQQKQKLAVYYYLGHFHFALGEYKDAIKHFRVTQRFGFAPLASTYYLGYAFLRLGEYDEAFGQFCSLYDRADKLRQQKPLRTIIEPEKPIGHISLGEMLALAQWGQAFVYAERETNSQRALELINAAQGLIECTFGKHNTDQAPCLAYPDYQAWILDEEKVMMQSNAWKMQ